MNPNGANDDYASGGWRLGRPFGAPKQITSAVECGACDPSRT